MIYTIQNEVLTIEINSLGAEMISVKMNGKERLWQNENGGWNGHAPVLFPKCGDCSVVMDGNKSDMKNHGFARSSEFSVVEKTENAILLKISSNEETKAVYPYDFCLSVSYRLEGAKLYVGYDIYNPSDAPMYASCGSHESYTLAGEIDEYEAVFEKEEVFDSLVHDGNLHCLNGEVEKLGSGTVLKFPKAFMEDNTLIFKNVNSRKVTVRKIGGEKVMALEFEGFPNLLFWHPAGSKMVCVAPWLNMPDDISNPNKEFSTRDGVQKIEPKQNKYFEHIIEYF